MHVEMLADVSRVGPLADFKEVVGEAQSTEGAMKILFLATAACLFLSLSSSAQAQARKFSDQYCVPYCTRLCADIIAGRKPPANPNSKVDSPGFPQRCMSHCVPMCHELGH
jgi:hypothetical protein